jgi:hypothetical protein
MKRTICQDLDISHDFWHSSSDMHSAYNEQPIRSMRASITVRIGHHAITLSASMKHVFSVFCVEVMVDFDRACQVARWMFKSIVY